MITFFNDKQILRFMDKRGATATIDLSSLPIVVTDFINDYVNRGTALIPSLNTSTLVAQPSTPSFREQLTLIIAGKMLKHPSEYLGFDELPTFEENARDIARQVDAIICAMDSVGITTPRGKYNDIIEKPETSISANV